MNKCLEALTMTHISPLFLDCLDRQQPLCFFFQFLFSRITLNCHFETLFLKGFFVVVVVTISFKSASWNCEKKLNHRRFYKLTDSVHSK